MQAIKKASKYIFGANQRAKTSPALKSSPNLLAVCSFSDLGGALKQRY